MSTPVRHEPPPTAPEELVLGPRPRRRWPRWFSVVVVIVGLLILGGAVTWRFWPRPVDPMSLADLQDTYAGMVRSDGTNDASVLTRETVAETPVTVSPAECAPLVQATMANRIPDTALDGVGTYWFVQSSTISLFTMRFPDAATADAERARIVSALDACADREVSVRRTEESEIRAWQATAIRVTAGAGADDQVGYVLSGPNGLLAIQLMPYLNTLTWQFRYETGSTSYSPVAADQLMQSLRAQLESVANTR